MQVVFLHTTAYYVRELVVDVFKETVAFGERCAAVFDQIECSQLSKRGQQLFDLLEKS